MRIPHLHTLLNETRKKSEETENHQIIDVLFKVWIMKNLHFAYAMLQKNENKYKSVLKNPLQTRKTKSVSQSVRQPCIPGRQSDYKNEHGTVTLLSNEIGIVFFLNKRVSILLDITFLKAEKKFINNKKVATIS